MPLVIWQHSTTLPRSISSCKGIERLMKMLIAHQCALDFDHGFVRGDLINLTGESIPLWQLQNPTLLLRLKAKGTIEPTEFMSKATGVSPHVMQLNLLMTSLLELCQIALVKVNGQANLVRQSIFDAMKERAIENGQIVDIRSSLSWMYSAMAFAMTSASKLGQSGK